MFLWSAKGWTFCYRSKITWILINDFYRRADVEWELGQILGIKDVIMGMKTFSSLNLMVSCEQIICEVYWFM